MFQRLPVHKLHRDVGRSGFFANVVDGANVGVVQPRGSLGFPSKTLQSGGVFGRISGEEFQSNRTLKAGILSFIDHTHTAAELLYDAVVRDGSADHSGDAWLRVARFYERGCGQSTNVLSSTSLSNPEDLFWEGDVEAAR